MTKQIFLVSLVVSLLTACLAPREVVFITATPMGAGAPPPITIRAPDVNQQPSTNSGGEIIPATATAGLVVVTPASQPTPNSARPYAIDPGQDQTHIVQFGETLAGIAQAYGVTVEQILSANNMSDGNFLAVGQQLVIPLSIQFHGTAFKTIPDAELIYGPSVGSFNTIEYLDGSQSWLANYTETLNGRVWTGPELVQRVAYEQSINPRILLALLEYENNLLTQRTVSDDVALYPLNYTAKPTTVYGLYRQLDWAAKMLQTGYYGWKYRGLSATIMADGTRAGLDPSINAGTAGVQLTLAQTRFYQQWLDATDYSGFYSTYVFLFGDPFAYSVEPIIPYNLTQPSLTFPWAVDETWYYTGGPHGGWGSASTWAALDFVPAPEVLGCELPPEYARAVADGVIALSEFGLVVLDLDGDGDPGTGWTIFYLHVATEDRQVEKGDIVKAGDAIGKPSCEGGVSFASHLHIGRRFNGEWIAADCTSCLTDNPTPQWVMDGWAVFTFESEYDGSLIKDDEYREACACRAGFNTFSPADRE